MRAGEITPQEKEVLKLRSTFSLDVADYIRQGKSISEALLIVLGGIQDGSGPKTTDVLADLKEMGIGNG